MSDSKRATATKRNPKATWLLALAAAAAAGGIGGSSLAMAQYRVEQGQGDALDANPRVGSGGRNEVRRDDRVTGNQIITGNVTGGKEFRGDVPYRDQYEFRGTTAGREIDRFQARSAGTAGAANAAELYGNVPRPFYGQGRAVPPPQGFVPEGYGTGAYVPESALVRPDRAEDRPFTQVPVRESILTDPNLGRQDSPLITGSPLTGVRSWDQSQVSADAYLENLYGGTRRTGLGADRILLSDDQISQMRQELFDAAAGEGDVGLTGAVDDRVPVSGAQVPLALDARVEPGELPGIQTQELVEQSNRERTTLPPPERQSTQYAEMQRRLIQRGEGAQAEQGQADPSQPSRRAGQPLVPGAGEDPSRPQGAEPLIPGMGNTGRQPLIPGQQGDAPQQPADAPAAGDDGPQSRAQRLGIRDYAGETRDLLEEALGEGDDGEAGEGDFAGPAPVRVGSLAEGVSAEGLKALLADAERYMQNGRFSAALEQYDAAQRVAPNNPLIRLGRAHAELGAGYYARAGAHLRDAFMADPALLMGQYDLKSFFGEDRLAFIINDLKQIAADESQQAQPMLLLAYIAYNTGDPRTAIGYLDLAERRSGGNDPLYDRLRQHWNLGGGGADEGAGSANPAAPEPADADADAREPSADPTAPQPADPTK